MTEGLMIETLPSEQSKSQKSIIVEEKTVRTKMGEGPCAAHRSKMKVRGLAKRQFLIRMLNVHIYDSFGAFIYMTSGPWQTLFINRDGIALLT
jgi:hypothetical protein